MFPEHVLVLLRMFCENRLIRETDPTVLGFVPGVKRYVFHICNTETAMPQPSLETLGQLVADKRGRHGVRATAEEIGISPATLSRVENGHLPDLENFRKICRWLKVDPSAVLGFDEDSVRRPIAAVHFRKKRTMELETARALADMILAAQRALNARDEF